jgi:hypothetical protein
MKWHVKTAVLTEIYVRNFFMKTERTHVDDLLGNINTTEHIN